MGSKYELKCDCGYQAESSGGDDLGMACLTTTILCEQCRELHDVMISDKPWDGFDKADEPKCPKDPGHKIQRWTAPGPCPKCGRTLTKGPPTALWD